MAALVSVIIPVYNVEKYLNRCLESIVGQTYNNLEIILVDDGSTDSSGLICDEWAKKDSRIKVIHKLNGGLGYARNSGLSLATGKYLSFVDSDDYLKITTYSDLINIMEKSNSDICYFGCDYDISGKIVKGKSNFPEIIYGQELIKKQLIPLSFGASIEKKKDLFGIGSVCCALFKKALFDDNRLQFESEREVLCEDILFTSRLLVCARKICFSNINYYYYFKNSNSLTHSYRPDRFEKAIKFYNLQNKLIDDNTLGKESQKRAKYSLLINLMVCIRQESRRQSANVITKIKNIKRIVYSEIVQDVVRNIDLTNLNIKKRLLFWAIKYKLTGIVLLLGHA